MQPTRLYSSIILVFWGANVERKTGFRQAKGFKGLCLPPEKRPPAFISFARTKETNQRKTAPRETALFCLMF